MLICHCFFLIMIILFIALWLTYISLGLIYIPVWSIIDLYYFSRWLYCLSPFGLPKIELYYLYNWWLTYVTCLYYLSIIFILFINNHWFSLWFSYDYFITLLFTSIWLTYTTELSFIYIIYLIITSILFVSLWLIYTTDITSH